jgi:hypothetical protein
MPLFNQILILIVICLIAALVALHSVDKNIDTCALFEIKETIA